MTNEQLKTFIALPDELEPENLYEDGEISGDEAIQKERRLLSQWKKLENEVGRRVTVEEIQKTWINQLGRS